MKFYKVCLVTRKKDNSKVCTLTHIIEVDDKDEVPKDYEIENERYVFNYKFADTKEQANRIVCKID